MKVYRVLSRAKGEELWDEDTYELYVVAEDDVEAKIKAELYLGKKYGHKTVEISSVEENNVVYHGVEVVI